MTAFTVEELQFTRWKKVCQIRSVTKSILVAFFHVRWVVQHEFIPRVRLLTQNATVMFWDIWEGTFGANKLNCGSVENRLPSMTTCCSELFGKARFEQNRRHFPSSLLVKLQPFDFFLSPKWGWFLLRSCRSKFQLRCWWWSSHVTGHTYSWKLFVPLLVALSSILTPITD